MPCRVFRVGLIEYGDAWRLQKELCYQLASGDTDDALLLVEHPPTITVGKSGGLDNVLAGQEELKHRSVSVFFTDRGGDVTYHCPGQLVIYPIVDLRRRERDVHGYVRDLEEVVIRTLRHYEIGGERKSHAGVWVDGKQIAAIGIAVKRWITMHGIALNVSPSIEDFRMINPCGLSGVAVTSISQLTGRRVDIESVADIVIDEYSAVFVAQVEQDKLLRL